MSVPVAAPMSPAEITRRSKSSFGVSFLFLDRKRREAMTSVYAFCRVIDDIADNPTTSLEAKKALLFWREELGRAYTENGKPETATGAGLQRAAAEFGVRRRDLDEILDGVERDLEPVPYATFADLEGYCHQVAAAVGLACLPILGGDPERDSHRDYAVSLGLALQLTNILRDLRSDAGRNRVYVPQELLVAEGFDIDIANQLAWLRGEGPQSVYEDGGALHAVMRVLAHRAESHFLASRSAFQQDHPAGFTVAEMMAAVYLELLQKLRACKGRLVLREKPLRISRLRKFYLALRTRWRGHR